MLNLSYTKFHKKIDFGRLISNIGTGIITFNRKITNEKNHNLYYPYMSILRTR